MTRRLPRYRMAPVERFLADRGVRGVDAVAQSLGITDRSLQRARVEGSLSLATADRWACSLGVHPSAVWVDWYEVQFDYGDHCADDRERHRPVSSLTTRMLQSAGPARSEENP